MINLFTRRDKIAEVYPDYTLITSNDIYFMQEWALKDLDETDFETMKIIDNIKITFDINGKPIIFESPFGTLSMLDFSTGCKTAINLNHILKRNKKHILDLTQCGGNALHRCFSLIDNSMLPVLLQHGRFKECEGFEFKVNGELITKEISKVEYYCMEGD